MGSFSNYTENKVLDHIVGKTAFTMPSTVAVALSTTVPTDAGNVTEPSGNGYARVITTGATWNASADGTISNAQDITFPEATGSWGTIVGFAIYDATTSGNMLVHGTLDQTKSIGAGDTAKFAGGTPGALKIVLD